MNQATIHRLFLITTLLTLAGCARREPVEEIRAKTSDSPVTKAPVSLAEQDWPWWRGQSRDNHAPGQKIPDSWSESENVQWRIDLPGQGWSSPIVLGDNLYLTTAEEDSSQQSLIALDRKTGTERWRRVLHKGALPKKHHKNSHASETPASDGETIYTAMVNDGRVWVSAVDTEGKVLWQSDVGPFRSEHGYGPSPVLHESLIIVNGDNLNDCFIAAVDRETGKIVWRTKRPTTGNHGGYATPIVAELAGKPQVVLMGMGQTSSYDPTTGKLLWRCDGPAEVAACSVAFNDDTVFASGGYPEKNLLAIGADGSGDVTDTHVKWKTTKNITYVPSPIHLEGKLFLVNDRGVASCLDATTGEELGKRRLPGAFTASPTLIGDRLYVPNEKGTVYVVKADPSLEIITTNELGEDCYATPVASKGQLFLRTHGQLFCIGDASAQPSS
ncbi:outer membrane biogenesis protein BamB [Planctomycetes bacterium Pan216]|uniref:Outer membrane biogenesis protein BamB n=1 Tax=Kolteria novifilia TaxID=2527975 RepID=A0A518B902_9BACT|nr:outer membrane biogenesis protein BamB [Planctomycetes bacterium Pan216]